MKPVHYPLVLAGAGHAHLVAVRRWISNQYKAPQGTILLSPSPRAWYSGMMPGLVAGRFTKDECAIELAPLCKACGIELVIGEIVGLNAAGRHIKLSNNQTLEYDYLSLNVGSVPPLPELNDNSVDVVPAKPFSAFNRKWEAWRAHKSPSQLAVLGGGAAAFELALALQKSLPLAQLSLVCSGDLLNAYSSGLQKRALKTLSERGVKVCNNTRIDRINDGWLLSNKQKIRSVDALVVATGAAPLAWQSGSGLECISSGFIKVSANLQSTSHREVLASGDCASQPDTPHSGVYAVRQGAVLSDIIPALLKGETLKEYKPQANALALLSTADGKALLNYGRFSGGGRLFGLYKDYLDLGFMRRHRLP
jgi:NADH dehydrogenase FAD-containing subunit